MVTLRSISEAHFAIISRRCNIFRTNQIRLIDYHMVKESPDTLSKSKRIAKPTDYLVFRFVHN